MKIAILTKSCKYFAAPYLAKALNADLYALDHTQNNFFDIECNVKRLSKDVGIKCDHLIIIGTRALLDAERKINLRRYKTVAVIFSDTTCARLEKKWKEIVKKYNIFTYAMPDLMQYCLEDTVPVFQTITLPDMSINKSDDKIVISHSPGLKGEFKGTSFIECELEKLKKKYDFDFNVSTDATWIDCLKTKASANIFIDQITLGNEEIDQNRFRNKKKYLGVVGKSGLEAMLLSCCTISGCPEFKTDKYFPCPPVIFTSYKKFKKDLEKLLKDKILIKTIAQEQKEWAEKYLSPEFVAMHITRHINKKYVIVVDFNQPITSKRLYLVDTEIGEIILSDYVGHSPKNGLIYPTNFFTKFSK